MNTSRNYFVAMAAIAALAETAPAKFHSGRRRPEFKDLAGEVADALKSINASVQSIGDRIGKLESSTELKSLDAEVKGLKADLAAAKAGFDLSKAPELKSLDDKLVSRLDAIERKINEAVINQAGGAKGKARNRKSWDALTPLMRDGRDIAAELKSLDSDLKRQDVFLDGSAVQAFPLLGLAFRRPTASDAPRYGFNTGAVVVKKGSQESQTANARKKVVFAVDTYEYQPEIEREDVNDVGASILDDELTIAGIEFPKRLNADLVDAIEAAALASNAQGFDAYYNPVAVDTAGTSWAESDLETLIASLPVRYRGDAVFIGNAAMTATLKNLRDENDRSLWEPSMAAGTPPTLKGYKYIEDENVAANRLIFGSPRWGLAIFERETTNLSNIEREKGNYLPYYACRYALGTTDGRALKVMNKKVSQG